MSRNYCVFSLAVETEGEEKRIKSVRKNFPNSMVPFQKNMPISSHSFLCYPNIILNCFIFDSKNNGRKGTQFYLNQIKGKIKGNSCSKIRQLQKFSILIFRFEGKGRSGEEGREGGEGEIGEEGEDREMEIEVDEKEERRREKGG